MAYHPNNQYRPTVTLGQARREHRKQHYSYCRDLIPAAILLIALALIAVVALAVFDSRDSGRVERKMK